MARTYFRRGSSVDFAIPAAPTLLPNLSIITSPTDADLLVALSLSIRNDGAVVRRPEITLHFGTGTASDAIIQTAIPAGERITFSKVIPVEGPQPFRTWSIQVTGDVAADQVSVAFRSSLLVIELPDWQTFSIFT